MGWSFEVWAASAAVGVGATAVMDGFGVLRARLSGQPGMNWALVGRWLGHVAQGRWVLARPAEAAAVPCERALGWAFHYAAGVALALGLTLLAGPGWLTDPNPFAVLSYGVATVVAPMCTMQPGMGLGLAACRVPQPWVARRRSLITHLVFGVGLFVSAIALGGIRVWL